MISFVFVQLAIEKQQLREVEILNTRVCVFTMFYYGV